jgi:hypothetical protein
MKASATHKDRHPAPYRTPGQQAYKVGLTDDQKAQASVHFLALARLAWTSLCNACVPREDHAARV